MIYLIFFTLIGVVIYFILQSSSTTSSYDHKKQVYKGDIKEHEAGLLVSLIAKVSKNNLKISTLRAEILAKSLKDISNSFKDLQQIKERLKEVYKEERGDLGNILQITRKYNKLARGNYKKRLQVLEYLLTIAFIDKEFDAPKRRVFEDISFGLDIKKYDFGTMVNEYEKLYLNKRFQDTDKVVGVGKGEFFVLLSNKYKNLVRENYPYSMKKHGELLDKLL